MGPPTAPPAEEGSPENAQGSDAQADSPEAGESVEKDLDALLSDVQRERDEYLELAQRTKADFENYRKRMSSEVQAAGRRGKTELAAGLIGVIDNLERALEAAGIDSTISSAATSERVGPVEQGILLTFRDLHDVLKRENIEAFDPKGEKFDPRWHEALSTQPADGVDSGTVVEVVQKGYRAGEQLIRPARVVVSE